MRTISVMIGCALMLAAVPGWAGTTTIDFSNGIGLLTGQNPAGRLQAVGGRAVFTGSNTTVLMKDGSHVVGNGGTVSATMGLVPYSDAQNGVGLIMFDTSDEGNVLKAVVDGDGMVVLSDWIGNERALDFNWPAALNSMTLQYDTYGEQATLTLNGSSSVSLDGALFGASSVYIGVFSYGSGGFASFSATGSGIPDYPPPVVAPPNKITAQPSGFIEEDMRLLLTAPQGSIYHWKKDNAYLTDATNSTMTIDPVAPGDAGTYTCGYTTITHIVKETDPYILVVYEPGTLPVTGDVGTAFLAGLVALSGVAAICFRRRRVAS